MVALGVHVGVGDTTDGVTVTRGTEEVTKVATLVAEEVGEDAVGTLPPFNELQPTSSINERHTLILFNIAKPNIEFSLRAVCDRATTAHSPRRGKSNRLHQRG